MSSMGKRGPMSRGAKARKATIEVLINSSSVAQTPATALRLASERQALDRALRMTTESRLVLQVLHTSRLLEGFLAGIVAVHHVPHKKPGALGNYLYGLASHSRPTIQTLGTGRRDHFIRNVVRIRNHYLHSAGAFPTKRQADELLGSIHTCIAEVSALE